MECKVNVLLHNCKKILRHCHSRLARQYIVCKLVNILRCAVLVDFVKIVMSARE